MPDISYSVPIRWGELSLPAMNLSQALSVFPSPYAPAHGWLRDYYNDCLANLDEEETPFREVLDELIKQGIVYTTEDINSLDAELKIADHSLVEAMDREILDQYTQLGFRYALTQKVAYDKKGDYPYDIFPTDYVQMMLSLIGLTFVTHNFEDMTEQEIDDYRTNLEHNLDSLSCTELQLLVDVCMYWADMYHESKQYDVLAVAYDEALNILDYIQEKFGFEKIIELKDGVMMMAHIQLVDSGEADVFLEYILEFYNQLKAYRPNPSEEWMKVQMATTVYQLTDTLLTQKKYRDIKPYTEEVYKMCQADLTQNDHLASKVMPVLVNQMEASKRLKRYKDVEKYKRLLESQILRE